VSVPTEAKGRVPNLNRAPGERSDLRPHGTEARARRERRKGGKPCPACRVAELNAQNYRRQARAGGAS